MQIVVTHLTRMQRGTVCAAGLDVESSRHIRPVPPLGVLQSRVTTPRGGPFDLATVVDLGPTRPVPAPPEIEDHEFTWWHARAAQAVEPGLYWELIGSGARRTVRELFGPDLRTVGQTGNRRAVVDLGKGTASLGVLLPRHAPRLTVGQKPDGRPVLRREVMDDEATFDFSVTDLRLYTDDGASPDLGRVQDVAARLRRGVPTRLGVGLTRPFASRPGEAPVHWLQVNNLHLEDDPCWRLAPERSPANRAGAPAGAVGPDRPPF